MRQILLLMLLLLVVCTVTPGAADSINWVKWTGDGSNGHWYALVSTINGISWTDAKRDAGKYGGYLATLTSEGEDYWVFSWIVKPAYNTGSLVYGPWLGGYRKAESTEHDGGWQWDTVEGTPETWSYTNWNIGEPNNVFGGENSLHYFLPGTNGSKWNDAPDSTQYGFRNYVMESNVSPVPEAGTVVAVCSILSPSFLFFRRRRK